MQLDPDSLSHFFLRKENYRSTEWSNVHALGSTSRGARERRRDGVGRRGGEHREAQRGVEEGGGGRQEQRPSKISDPEAQTVDSCRCPGMIPGA